RRDRKQVVLARILQVQQSIRSRVGHASTITLPNGRKTATKLKDLDLSWSLLFDPDKSDSTFEAYHNHYTRGAFAVIIDALIESAHPCAA
ncbi:hypothetical protein LTR60_004985, partial [Cryomyces antarcticus]